MLKYAQMGLILPKGICPSRKKNFRSSLFALLQMLFLTEIWMKKSWHEEAKECPKFSSFGLAFLIKN